MKFSTAQNTITRSNLMGLLVTCVFKSIRKKGLSQINWKTPVIFSNSNANELPSGEEKDIHNGFKELTNM